MTDKEWRVDWLGQDGWVPFWFGFGDIANNAFEKWSKYHRVRLVALTGDKAEIVKEA